MESKVLVFAGVAWDSQALNRVLVESANAIHPAASRYYGEVLWPADYDPETRDKLASGEFTHPTFEQWRLNTRWQPEDKSDGGKDES